MMIYIVSLIPNISGALTTPTLIPGNAPSVASTIFREAHNEARAYPYIVGIRREMRRENENLRFA